MMKKQPTLQRKKRKATMQSIGVVALVALMLAVSYLGISDMRTAAVALPVSRVAEIVEASLPPAGVTTALVATGPDAGIPTLAPVTVQTETGFDSFRAQLTATRESSAKLLDEVILSASASAKTVQEAIEQKAALARSMEMESVIETLLEARGFPETLCTVREGSVNVIVRTQQLTQQQAAQILDVCTSESGEAAANVRIIPAV